MTTPYPGPVFLQRDAAGQQLFPLPCPACHLVPRLIFRPQNISDVCRQQSKSTQTRILLIDDYLLLDEL